MESQILRRDFIESEYRLNISSIDIQPEIIDSVIVISSDGNLNRVIIER